MATERMQHIDDSGLVLYAWPANRDIGLFWSSSFKVLLVPGSGSNATLYQADLDTSISGDWVVFLATVNPAVPVWTAWRGTWRAKDAAVVLPSSGSNKLPNRSKGEVVDTLYIGEAFTLQRDVMRGTSPVSLLGLSLVFTVDRENGMEKFVARGSDIVISGAANNSYSVLIPSTLTASTGEVSFSLRIDDASKVLLDLGKLDIAWAPLPD